MSKFMAGDKVRVVTKGKQSWPDVGREFVVKRAEATYVMGHGTSTDGHPDYGVYSSSLELVESPKPKFKIGDRVIANNMVYTDEEFTITAVVEARSSENGVYYYKGADYPFTGGVWEKYLTAAPREFRVGDLIRAEKGELAIAGRLSENIYSGLTIQALGWPLRSLERDKFTITLVEAAPEPVVDRFPLPEEPGLYISQAYVVFRLTEGGDWVEARANGRIEKVKPETLKSEKHWPLGLVAEPVDK